MDYLLFVVGLCLGVAMFAALVILLVKFCRLRPLGGITPKIDTKQRWIYIALILGIGLATIISSYGYVPILKASLQPYEIIFLLLGSFLFGSCFSLLFTSFVIYYYRRDLDTKQRKIARILTFVSIPLIAIGLWMETNAIADYLTYPLWNGLDFTKGFIFPNSTNLGFNIKFYGVLIVTGAAISYFVSDHYFYKKYGKHGILDTLLLVAFPAGIIGARLWYCLILSPGTNVFAIRDGGLAIQGGALFGIVFGVLFMVIFRRYINIRWAMDIIVPTILLAQVVGRWGNFFNCEVHGVATNMSNWWFIPKIIARNMQYSSVSGQSSLIGTDQMYVPLFLIEGCINLCGYFIIRYAIGKPLKKYLSLGDLSMCYVMWYGLVRIVMEPLRNSGDMYGQSRITAFVMLGVGALGIVAFHLYDFYRKKKGLPPKNLDTI